MLEEFSDILGNLVTVFGVIAALAYFPQIYKMYQNKSSADVSILTYMLFATGIAFWLLYGISMNNIPLIVANIAALIGSLSVVLVAIIYRRSNTL